MAMGPVLEWRLTQALPLGLGSASHGFTAPGGRGVALQLKRQATRAKVGPLNLEICVSDVVGLDGQLLHQQVVLQALSEAASELGAPWEVEPEFSRSELSTILEQQASRPRADPADAESCPHQQREQMGQHSSVPGDDDMVSAFQVHSLPDATLSSPSGTPQAHTLSLISAPSLTRKHSGVGWLSFLPPLRMSLTGSPMMLSRTGSLIMKRHPLMRISSTGRHASMWTRSASPAGIAPAAPQVQTLTTAPSLAGVVGVVAAMQQAWRLAVERAATDSAVASTTLISTGKVMEDMGGTLSIALQNVVELSTVLDTVAHKLHITGAAEAAGALHAVVGAVHTAGGAMQAAGSAMQAVGRWGLAHSAATDAKEVVETVEAVKGAVDSVGGAVSAVGGVVQTLGALLPSGSAGSGAVAGTASGSSAAGAAAASAVVAALGAAASGVSASGPAPSGASTTTASATSAVAAAAAAAVSSIAPGSSTGTGGQAVVGSLPSGSLPTGWLGPVDQVVGAVGSFKETVESVPGTVEKLVTALQQAGEAMHRTGQALHGSEVGPLQGVAGSMQAAGGAMRNASTHIKERMESVSKVVGDVVQSASSELSGLAASGVVGPGEQVDWALLRTRVAEVVQSHVARLNTREAWGSGADAGGGSMGGAGPVGGVEAQLHLLQQPDASGKGEGDTELQASRLPVLARALSWDP
mmetsp:Transcript_37533/g.83553  ORF Transcript_37533/g.83553 Transcript_37533/m.83553 type:complete len:696 (-) Transcript_37533:886-2973(-)|eukprot:CAMPEP_0202919140 /NCGR_PEP_ID=MMETSP1392-20130828/75127_1 /ASSEMBLY_ACC=CAM_ASM_000868 /TAXON_ID=225041 /ORGANISM="Chlamydomonas chlamydogama, Strain SAG 11-48b" /LENGTH=695 /DNA_ID=CAMNT_0049612387 /DNA_START=233 /DNA_END=2320 /DNA_ORIENTATION=+